MTDSDRCINAKPSTSEKPDLAQSRNIAASPFIQLLALRRRFPVEVTSVGLLPDHNCPPRTNWSHETISCVAHVVAGESFHFAAKRRAA